MKRTLAVVAGLGFVALTLLYYATELGEQQWRREANETIKIGMVTFPGYAPFYLAKEKGLFEGVNVELFRIEGIAELRAAMRSGSVQMYLATFDIFQAIQSQEPPGIGFLAVDESRGADGVAVAEGIMTVADLKGKTVGAEPGFPPYFVLQYILHKQNMTLKDLTLKDMASQDVGSAFVAKQLDAAGTYEPYLSKSVSQRPKSSVLVSSADLPGLIVDILFADEQLLSNKSDLCQRVAQGWFKAVEYYESHPDESMDIMAKAFNMSKKELEDMKKRLSWFTKEDNFKIFDHQRTYNAFKTFDEVGEILASYDPRNTRVSSEKKLTSKIVDELRK